MSNQQPETLLIAKRFRVVRHVQRLADGAEHVWETVQHPGSVVILPLFPDQSVCLIRNYRVAVGRTLVELPAGTLDREESPLETARRELSEETGLRAGDLQPLCEFFMSPGILNERMHLFLATNLARGAAACEPGEEIETITVPWERAASMVFDGTIQDAKTMLAILYYDQWRKAKPVV